MPNRSRTDNVCLGDDRCFLIRRCVISLCTVECQGMIGKPHIPCIMLMFIKNIYLSITVSHFYIWSLLKNDSLNISYSFISKDLITNIFSSSGISTRTRILNLFIINQMNSYSKRHFLSCTYKSIFRFIVLFNS